jgi:hypothetical protein
MTAGFVSGQSSNGSVRSRLEAQERDRAGDPIVRPPKAQSSVTGQHSFNVSVRDAARWKEFRAEEAATPTAVGSPADVYLAAHKREEAEKERQEAADIASGRHVIIDAGYEERRIRAEYAEKARQLVAAYDELGASYHEREWTNKVVRQRNPSEFWNVAFHRSVLLEIRELKED